MSLVQGTRAPFTYNPPIESSDLNGGQADGGKMSVGGDASSYTPPSVSPRERIDQFICRSEPLTD